MCSLKYLKPEYSPDEFAGTAVYYSRYRIPYPHILIKDLINRTTPSSQAKLLDLASGPGRIAIQLAPLFSRVLANDIDSEMISVGKIESKKLNIDNIEWYLCKAEELNLEPGSIDLITIGEAFHRLDQNLITNLALKWLKPKGYIVIMGCYNIFSGNELWQDIIKKFLSKWTSHRSANYKSFTKKNTNNGPEHFRLVLKDKGFVECNSYSFVIPYYWTIESIIGNLYSTSLCSKKVLGENIVEFESELKAELKKINEQGNYFENIRCGYTLGKKPLF